MQKEFANSLLKICSNPKLQEALDSILVEAKNHSGSVEVIQTYYSRIRSETEDLAKDYLIAPNDLDPSEVEANNKFFNEQLAYLWCRLISDWVRYNNLANYKLMFGDTEDFALQSKAAICSFFIQPLGLLIDKELLKNNLNFIYTLLDRSELSTDSVI
jgi:hypothetical protein